MMKDIEETSRLPSVQNWLQGRRQLHWQPCHCVKVSRCFACPWGANLNYPFFLCFSGFLYSPHSFHHHCLSISLFFFCTFSCLITSFLSMLILPTWPSSLFSPGLCLGVLLEVCGGSSPLSSFLLTQPTWLLS